MELALAGPEYPQSPSHIWFVVYYLWEPSPTHCDRGNKCSYLALAKLGTCHSCTTHQLAVVHTQEAASIALKFENTKMSFVLEI